MELGSTFPNTLLGWWNNIIHVDPMAEEMEELMQNKEFLQSVLSTLPGVNPEQALLNLREMTEASTSAASSGQGQEENKDKEKVDEKEKEKEEDEKMEEEEKVSFLTEYVSSVV